MPLNDQLLQIVRTSETTWDVKSVLPVSFATLLLPEKTDVKDQIKLRKYLMPWFLSRQVSFGIVHRVVFDIFQLIYTRLTQVTG